MTLYYDTLIETVVAFLRTTVRNDTTSEIADPSEEAIANLKRLLRGAPTRLEPSFAGPNCVNRFVATLRTERA